MQPIHSQLLQIVLPYLERFKDDLFVHDKAALENYNGKFLYGYRKTGTDLLKLLPDFETYRNRWTKNIPTDDVIEKWISEEIVWITYPDRNTKFMYFDGAKLTEITAEKAGQIHRRHAEEIIYINRAIKRQQQEIYIF